MTPPLPTGQARAVAVRFSNRSHRPVATVQHTDSRATNLRAIVASWDVCNCVRDNELGVIGKAVSPAPGKAPHLHSGSRRVDDRSGRSTFVFAAHSETLQVCKVISRPGFPRTE